MNVFRRLFDLLFKEPEEFVGYRKWIPTDEEWAELETNPNYLPKFSKELKVNQYLLCYVIEDGKEKLRAQYCFERDEKGDFKLRKFGRASMSYDFKSLKLDEIADAELELMQASQKGVKKSKTSKPKAKAKDTKVVINPRNDQQVCAFDLLKDRRKTVKLITGTWGTGKTMLEVGAALEGLCQGDFDKIVWIRNNVDVEGTKDLGALPGDIWEKEKPFVGPFIDHVGEQQVKKMLLKNQLIVEPLQYLRGRSFENAAILCSEAENLTKEHIQLIIARAGEGTEVFFDADCRQRDKAMFRRSQGVEKLIKRFTGKKLFGYVHLVKSERSATAAMADLLNEE